MVPAAVNHGRIRIGNDRNVMLLAIDQAIAVRIRADPLSRQLLDREFGAERVFVCRRSSVGTLRPNVDFVTATDDTVVADSRNDFGVRRRKWDVGARDRIVFWAVWPSRFFVCISVPCRLM